jgi:hypothetical protein
MVGQLILDLTIPILHLHLTINTAILNKEIKILSPAPLGLRPGEKT